MKQIWVVSATNRKEDIMMSFPVAVFTKKKDAMRYGNDMFVRGDCAYIAPLVLNAEKNNLGDW